MGLEQLFNSENLDVESIEKRIYETASNEEIVEINILNYDQIHINHEKYLKMKH